MREITVKIFDDLDYFDCGARNEADGGRLTIGLDGQWRELELTENNVKLVRETMDRLMTAGHKPDDTPASPRREYTHPDPERVAFFKGLRDWCKETHRRNTADTGWAFQTNDSLKHYYSEPLKAAYRAHLDEAEMGRLASGKNT